jgi:hypothetical protein
VVALVTRNAPNVTLPPVLMTEAPPLPVLSVEELGDSEEQAEVVRYFFPSTTSWSWFARADGSQTLTHVTCDVSSAASRWQVRQYALGASSTGAGTITERAERQLDLTIFDANAEQFVERERYQSRSGPNLHATPIVLPATLRRAEWCRPFPSETAQVKLAYAGPVALRLGAERLETRAIRLTAEQGSERGSQWMVEGVGEVWLGAEGGAPKRWLLGFSSDSAATLFGGAGPRPDPARLPPLDERGDRVPKQRLL